jgi:creatinine amidohydrolase
MDNKRVQFWHQLTALEIRTIAQEAVTILPLASTEQHGPHMVTGTDTLLNDLLQKGLAEFPPARGRFLILPTLPLGTSEHHVPFGGTLTIPPILYTQVLVAMLRSLIRQGHNRIFLLNSHGGNQASLTTALGELAQEATEEGVLLGGASYWAFSGSAWKNEIPELKLKQVGHACEIEASLLMIARPDLPLRSHPAGHPFPAFLNEGWSLAGDYSTLSPDGFVGYPQEASIDKGERLFQIAIRTLGDFFSRYAELPLPRDLRPGEKS